MSILRHIKAVGFDLGETLIHYGGLPLSWQSLYETALKQVAAACEFTATAQDISLGEHVLARYNTRLHPREEEVTSDQILGEVLTAWGVVQQPHREAASEAFFSYFQQSFTVYEDTIATLEEVQARNINIGILTDVPYGMEKRFVQRDVAPIAKYVDLLLTSVEVGFRKPHPSGFLVMADKLDVDPKAMIYVGNEPKDIEGANAAGMISVLIDRNNIDIDLGQRFMVKTLHEIIPLLA